MRSFDQIRKDNDLLFESIRGSQLYGLSTPESDVDTFGVYSASKEELFGTGLYYAPLVTSDKNDDAWSELSKFVGELGKSNPSALEAIFTPSIYVQHFDPVLEELWAYRDHLITKKCFESFSSYAVSQLRKAKGLKKLINMDPEEVKVRKSPLDFCWIAKTDNDGTESVLHWLERQGLKACHCGATRLRNGVDLYSVYYDWGADPDTTLTDYVRIIYGELGLENLERFREEYMRTIEPGRTSGFIKYRGLLDPNNESTLIRLSSISKEDAKFPIFTFQFNSGGFSDHCVKYKRYWEWVEKRNPVRYENNLGHDYDSKNLMHVVRLLTMASEIARGEGLRLNREGLDRDFLLSIKSHKLSYDEVMEYATDLERKMNEDFAKSDLAVCPDREELERILINIRKRKFDL